MRKRESRIKSLRIDRIDFYIKGALAPGLHSRSRSHLHSPLSVRRATFDEWLGSGLPPVK
jgi:hypothetical protein